MAMEQEVMVDIPGLSGKEIIVDLCEQIASKLHRDCNLRGEDSYVNGYAAEVSVKIHCYGIDTADVDATINVSKRPAQLTEGPAKTTEIETQVSVAHEPDLQAVRERSEQAQGNVEMTRQPLENEETEQKPQKVVNKRRYAAKPEPVAGGGAGDFEE